MENKEYQSSTNSMLKNKLKKLKNNVRKTKVNPVKSLKHVTRVMRSNYTVKGKSKKITK